MSKKRCMHIVNNRTKDTWCGVPYDVRTCYLKNDDRVPPHQGYCARCRAAFRRYKDPVHLRFTPKPVITIKVVDEMTPALNRIIDGLQDLVGLQKRSPVIVLQ